MSSASPTLVYLTPPQVAERFGIDPEKVRAFIDSGELRAINVAAKRCSRPRWRISPDALADFEASRSATPPPTVTRRRRRDPSIKQFF